MKCHSLCAKKLPLVNHAKLLGLGAKFCIQTRKLHQDNLLTTLKRFACDVRVKHCVQTHMRCSDETAPKLCIKNTNYDKTPRVPPPIEEALKRFELLMLILFKAENKPKNSNLTKLQQNILHYFNNYLE